jgi:hypothetical protein
MRSLFTLFCLLFVTLSVQANEYDAEVAKLMGKHRLTLQWISWDKPGRAIVKKSGNDIVISGSQIGVDGDFLTIEGKIIDAAKDEFTFEGSIATRVSHINNGETCVREGVQVFQRTKPTRKYWRLQNMTNPCTQIETDYIDLFFH